MFGMGFTEILIIGVIAILFLGPDKLPEAMVEIAKIMKNLKHTITSAKDSIESELHVSEMKEEMMSYKKKLSSASGEFNRMASLDDLQTEIDNIKNEVTVDIPAETTQSDSSVEPEIITFNKKSKKDKKKKENKENSEVSDSDV